MSKDDQAFRNNVREYYRYSLHLWNSWFVLYLGSFIPGFWGSEFYAVKQERVGFRIFKSNDVRMGKLSLQNFGIIRRQAEKVLASEFSDHTTSSQESFGFRIFGPYDVEAVKT